MSNLNLVETTVTLSDKKIHFVELRLNQKFNAHHRCEILVDFEELDATWMNDPVKIIKYIGESVVVEMKHKQTGETNIFKGIVTDISMVGRHGQQNHILIKAASDTIRLDGKPTMNSFLNKSLQDVVAETVIQAGNGAKVSINPRYKQSIEYICQYQESAFNFFNKLSQHYGEWFYYSGTEIYFGAPIMEEPCRIMYDIEMTHFDLEAKLRPAHVGRFNYQEEDHQEWIKRTRKEEPDTFGYLRTVQVQSDSIYTSDARVPSRVAVDDSDSLLRQVDLERAQDLSNMLVLKGTTQTCKVQIGKTIMIVFPKTMDIVTSAGSFVVTDIVHKVDQEGHYSNTFEAVPASMKSIPFTAEISTPLAMSQIATVIGNADPTGIGRVQVQFQWQSYLSKNTSWIRVQTPDAGSSGVVNKNRGFVFIPEVGDQVMVGFEYGDPDRPYVMGSMFHGINSSGGKVDNHIKSIMTRSGIKIIFNDDEGSLHIEDPSGNTWDMDGKSNIYVNAPKNMTINVGETLTQNSKNMIVNVAENLNVNVGNNKEEIIQKDYKLLSSNQITDITSNKTIRVTNSYIQTSGEANIQTLKGDLKLRGMKLAIMQGGQDVKISKG